MYQYYIKRVVDILISLLVIPILAVIFLPIAILIKIEDRGPVFFMDTRLGKDMKQFKMFKFRSMKVNAPDIRNEDGTTYNSKDDPRVTKIGKILRKTSIDEIPQIINVLTGDMSLVGPRPSPLGDKSIYPQEFFKKFEVKPGITGYNQALLRNNSTMEQRIENDVFYVDNVAFLLDVKIIYLTIKNILRSKDIYRNTSSTNTNNTEAL